MGAQAAHHVAVNVAAAAKGITALAALDLPGAALAQVRLPLLLLDDVGQVDGGRGAAELAVVHDECGIPNSEFGFQNGFRFRIPNSEFRIRVIPPPVP